LEADLGYINKPIMYYYTISMAGFHALISLTARALVDFFLNNRRKDLEFTWKDLKIGYTEQE
jgi:hypothetical protein